MSDTQETIADIIAEMRALSNPISDGIIAINGRIIADRLEAEHKRELSKNASKNGADFGHLGNCAKLREALEHVLHLDATDDAAMEGGLTDGERIAEYADHIEECQKRARAALAAPPRNCDRYATVDEAMDDFADEALIEQWNALKAGKDRDMLAEELFVFTKWLFVPATEKEGGNDGSK